MLVDEKALLNNEMSRLGYLNIAIENLLFFDNFKFITSKWFTAM